MKKIMFSDQYRLNDAVLVYLKTHTRRVIRLDFVEDYTVNKAYRSECWEAIEKSVIARYAKFKVGEIVAIAQSYKSAGVSFLPEEDEEFGCHNFPAEQTKGWTNKMFVRADLMPHQIRITNVRVEKLQDISDEDCIREGVREVCVSNNWGNSASHWEFQIPYDDKFGRTKLLRGTTPREAYAALIDRISGKGTWERNPFVFVYEFELVK